MPVIINKKPRSFLLIIFLGLAAGLLVAFFSTFPNDTLWSFSFFSSSTVGFWIFTCSLIVFFSEKHILSSVNTTIYVYLMFLVTAIFKTFRNYNNGYSSCEGITELIAENILHMLFYGFIPSFACGVLAFILWYGKRNNLLGKIIVLSPFFVITLECTYMFFMVFTKHRMLFMALVDLICAATYLFILIKRRKLISEV